MLFLVKNESVIKKTYIALSSRNLLIGFRDYMKDELDNNLDELFNKRMKLCILAYMVSHFNLMSDNDYCYGTTFHKLKAEYTNIIIEELINKLSNDIKKTKNKYLCFNIDKVLEKYGIITRCVVLFYL